MDRLAGATELLDGPLDDPDALRGNLRDLRRLNRLTGGARISARAIAALTSDEGELSVIDVGTGAADIPVALISTADGGQPRLRVTGVEHRAEVLAAAREETPGLDALDGLSLELADGRSLPYSDGAFDVAHASFVLHHLEPSEAGVFLAELGRVARRGVVINDLERRRLTLLGAWLAAHLLTRNRYTRHDAPLSARRAYTAAEAGDLLIGAGLRPMYEARAALGTRWAIAAARS